VDRRTGTALVGSVLMLGLLAGCTAGSNTAASPAIGSAGSAGEARAAVPLVPDQAQGKAQQGAQQVPLAPAERKVVRTAALELRSDDVSATMHSARDFGPQVGGYVSQEDSRPEGGSLTLRVPNDKLDGVIEGLGKLVRQGDVVSRTERADDVTEQVVDVESRLASQRASVARVRALLDRASSVSDVVQVEGEIGTAGTTTKLPAVDVQCVFAPDGNRLICSTIPSTNQASPKPLIAFLFDVAAQKATNWPAAGQGFAWRPDGTKVAYWSGGSVLVAAPDGSGPIEVGKSPQPSVQAWSPNGQFLLFANQSGATIVKADGSGLGLPLVKAIMELHGGTLRLESAPNAGTRATITFPPDRLVFDALRPAA